MIDGLTYEEACAVEGVIHLVGNDEGTFTAYQQGDALPDYCLSDAQKGIIIPEVSDMDQLKAQLAALQAAVIAAGIKV